MTNFFDVAGFGMCATIFAVDIYHRTTRLGCTETHITLTNNFCGIIQLRDSNLHLSRVNGKLIQGRLYERHGCCGLDAASSVRAALQKVGATGVLKFAQNTS